MIDYCDLCEKKKQVKRSDDYALKVCESCNKNFPEDDYCKDMQQDRQEEEMTVVERIKIEMREMEGYDISDIDYENYVHDRIDQQYERIKNL